MSAAAKLEQLRQQIKYEEALERQRNWNRGEKRSFGGVVYVTRKEVRRARALHRAEKSFGKEPKHGRKKADSSAP